MSVNEIGMTPRRSDYSRVANFSAHMNLNSMTEETTHAGSAKTADRGLARDSGPASARPVPSKRRTSRSSVKANVIDSSEARLYLAAMTHFFADLSAEGKPMDAE